MSRTTCIICIVTSITIALAAAPPIKLDAGIVQGTTCNNAPTSVYRGIPFAQPPVGDLRFMAPQPFNSSFPNGTWDATSFSATCIQAPGEFAWTEPSTSEDCLYLTVYVPPGNASSLPVKVWGYGGDDTDGSASYPLYDLCSLATDSIAVAIQYRLGPFGFLGLDAAGIEGNMGIKDYVAALEWVQANIAAFGGDPKKVLLFGQSSGADDAFVVSTLPQAKSLISSVICESGGGVDLLPYDTVQGVGASFAATANCSASDLSCLQSLSVDQVVSAYLATPVLYEGVGTYTNPNLLSWAITNIPNTSTIAAPFVDGSFIIEQPLIVGPQVPIVMGSNANDGSLFAAPPLYQSGYAITEDNYTEFLTQYGSQASAIAQQYPLSLFNASGSTSIAVTAALTHIWTVSGFTCFEYRGLRSALNAGTPAYAYIFNHTLSCPWLWNDGMPFPAGEDLEVFAQPMHTAELPLVFGNLDTQPWGNGTCNMDAVEADLSKSLKSSWTAMAASGIPSTRDLNWTRFDDCSLQGLYILNTTVVQPLDFSECEFWDQIWYDLGGVEFAWPTNQTCAANGTTSSGGNGTVGSHGQPSSSMIASNSGARMRVTSGSIVAAFTIFLLAQM